MKRLLLAPLLILLTGCSSDIVVKTDLNEKFIVKKSTVTLFPKVSDEIISEIESSGEEALKRFKDCVGNNNQLNRPVCNQREDIFLFDRLKADIKVEPEKIHWIKVQYRTIFIDINKKKSALGYQSISCPNPKLKSNTLKAWSYFDDTFGQKSNLLLSFITSNKAIDNLNKKICEKYAKFK